MIKKYKDQERGLKRFKMDTRSFGAIRFFEHIGFKPTLYLNTRSKSFFVELIPIVPYFANVWSSFERRYERNATSNQYSVRIYFHKICLWKDSIDLLLFDRNNHRVSSIRPNVLSNATITVYSTCSNHNRYRYIHTALQMNPTDSRSFLEFKGDNEINHREKATGDLYNERVFDWLLDNNEIEIEVKE